MNIRNDCRYSIKVIILDVRIFFWENGFRWWLFALLVLRDPLYESERFKESYYNYPLSFFKNKIEMSLFFTPKILRKSHYLHTSNFGHMCEQHMCETKKIGPGNLIFVMGDW